MGRGGVAVHEGLSPLNGYGLVEQRRCLLPRNHNAMIRVLDGGWLQWQDISRSKGTPSCAER